MNRCPAMGWSGVNGVGRCGWVMLWLGWALGLGCVWGAEGVTEEERARLVTRVEALTRLQNTDLGANAKLEKVVMQTLEQTRGTREYLRLVKHFRMTNQVSGVVELVRDTMDAELGGEAVRWLVGLGRFEDLERVISGESGAVAVRMLKSVSVGGDQKSWARLSSWVVDGKRDVLVRREVVKLMVRSQEGAGRLLKMVEEGVLPADVQFAVRGALTGVRWGEIKAAAARLLPAPTAAGNEVLPPVQELVQRQGSVGSGKALFSGKATCATCHVVAGQGVNFGPDLSQVGSKLGKDALYESILDPSAGVSFGYEAWLLTLKSGDEAMGLVASETEDEVVLKVPGGSQVAYEKKEVAQRQKQALSIMPAGLEQTMTVQELVDLVEFLSSLKKP